MKRLVVATAVLASALVLAAPAGAQVRSCPRPYGSDAVVMSIRAQNTPCWTAQQLAVDEWNFHSHWDYPGGLLGGRWHVTWRYDNSQAAPMTW